ncbi:selenocysteine-specific translation elongation factor [Crenobacter caeni]|uniref:Selenocysteine-specific translation elongation factor n=1 Tax=Crenobacter caeni TaxID=2705474 RepID=A0A6B2KUN8_9NEIS|nr:selenocysteine-specific translation elongation factor [Crenobacter caeni]NDV13848.1 selenocysteine-specific translation elongation factor [Crenobacter caeni]
MIVATAGHVDHGKTSLIRALTGTDADRLPEEKRRGMTLDLGYAFLERTDGGRIGFVDVPGHERFLGNMLAGVGGLDHALLVVAADDGVMPQTREHLAILKLAGARDISVVLSKRALVDDARALEVQAELDALFASLSLAPAARFEVDSISGDGIPALRDFLATLPETDPAPRRFRLAIDRVFTVKGAGLVVTGSALAGKVAVGDSVWLAGRAAPLRVRALHAQSQAAEQGLAGERLALNLVGDINREDVARGDWLLAQTPGAPCARATVVLSPLPGVTLAHWQAVQVHHGASKVTGRVALLDEALAELALDAPLWLADNDRLILRDASARETLAGARVLELAPPARGKRAPARLALLGRLAACDADSDALALLADADAVELSAFAWARQRDDVETLASAAGLKVAGGYAVSSARWDALADTLCDKLEALHAAQPDQRGAARERLKRLALPRTPQPLFDALVTALLADGQLAQSQGWLHLPGHVLAFSSSEAARWPVLEAQLGNADGWVRDLARAAGMEETEARALLKTAARLGLVVAVVPDRYYRAARVDALARTVREIALRDGHVDAATFRDAVGVGRKLAIQILEFFDRSGLTRRQGDRHLLRDTILFSPPAADGQA